MSDWIEQYTQWSMKRSPLSPRHFHRNIALAMCAGAIASRVCVKMPHATIYPNLYILIFASSTVYGKSTTFNWATEVVKQTMSDKVVYSVPTPEAIVETFSGKKPSNYDEMSSEEKKEWSAGARWGGKRLFMLDEAGRIFNTLSKDYNSDMGDILMKLYDPDGQPISRTTRGKGHESIKNYGLSCLFATTPRGIRNTLSSFDLWGSGFWVRWNFVTQEELTPWGESTYGDIPSNVLRTLKNLNSVWLESYNQKAKVLAPDTAVLKIYNENTRAIRDQTFQTKDERMKIVLGRLPTAHLKTATIYALLESEGKTNSVGLKHWEKAQDFVEGWKRDAEAALAISNKSEQMELEEQVYEYVSLNSSLSPTAREIARNLHKSVLVIQKIIDTYVKGGDFEEIKKGKTVGYSLLRKGVTK